MRKTTYILLIIGIFTSSCNQKNDKKEVIVNEVNDSSQIEYQDTLQGSISKNELTFEIVKEATEPHLYDENYGDSTFQTENGLVYEFMVVEQRPQFPGGDDSLFSYIKRSIEYPKTAKDDSIQGKVYVSFVVLKNGSIGQVEVMRGVRYDLDNVSVDAIMNMPPWEPGKLRGENVNVRFIIPIKYSLESDTKSKGAALNVENHKKTSVEIKLFPNPAKEYFNIEISEYANDIDYQLISSNGQILKTGSFDSNQIKIYTDNLGNGMYVVRIISKELGINRTEKLMINK